MRFEDALRGRCPSSRPPRTGDRYLPLPSQILRRVLESGRSACPRPSHAEEVAHDLPASVVAGCEDLEFAAKVQGAFNSDAFRVYGPDGYGAELAGALRT